MMIRLGLKRSMKYSLLALCLITLPPVTAVLILKPLQQSLSLSQIQRVLRGKELGLQGLF